MENALTNRGVLPGLTRVRDGEDVMRYRNTSARVGSRNHNASMQADEVPEGKESSNDTYPRDVNDQLLAIKKEMEVALDVPSATPEAFDELLKRAEKYVTHEEVKRAKKVETKSLTTENKKELTPKWPGPDKSKGSRSRPRARYEKYTPLKLELDEVLQVVADHPKIKYPYSRSRGPQRLKSNKSYRFHNEYGHNTNS
ncbi:hypothetical protein ACS0TY_010880 [Phlomoides rotata]